MVDRAVMGDGWVVGEVMMVMQVQEGVLYIHHLGNFSPFYDVERGRTVDWIGRLGSDV